jgi:hypothetical protein
MRFRHLALSEIKGATPVRCPAAVIISDYGLGLAIAESDAIAPPHGSLLSPTCLRIGDDKVRTPVVPRVASRSFVEPQRKADDRSSRIREMDLKLPQDLSRPSSQQQSDPGGDERRGRERREN